MTIRNTTMRVLAVLMVFPGLPLIALALYSFYEDNGVTVQLVFGSVVYAAGAYFMFKGFWDRVDLTESGVSIRDAIWGNSTHSWSEIDRFEAGAAANGPGRSAQLVRKDGERVTISGVNVDRSFVPDAKRDTGEIDRLNSLLELARSIGLDRGSPSAPQT